MRRVLVTGATGFLGEHVFALRPADCEVSVFARAGSDTSRISKGIKIHTGRFEEPESFAAALRGQDLLLNLASLGFGHAPAIVEACRRAKPARAVFVGSAAVFTSLPAASKAVRLEAEERLRSSGLDCVLLRPTMIYGTPRDRNIWRLIRFLRWSPIAPVLRGEGLQQPVHVEDVARAVWAAADKPSTGFAAFNIGGARPLRLSEMIEIIARKLGRSVKIVSVPPTAAHIGAAAMRVLPLFPGISREQIQRLMEDKSVDNEPARGELGYAPRDFAAGVEEEIRCLR